MNKETLASTCPMWLSPETEEYLWEGVWNSTIGSACVQWSKGWSMDKSQICWPESVKHDMSHCVAFVPQIH